MIPITEDITPKRPMPKYTVNFNYDISTLKDSRVPICKSTLRPWSKDRKTLLCWNIQAERKFGMPVASMLPVNKYYIDYVNCKRHFPSKKDLILYIFRREKRSLPIQIELLVESIISEYENIIEEENISPQLFNDITQLSMNIQRRIQMEKRI